MFNSDKIQQVGRCGAFCIDSETDGFSASDTFKSIFKWQDDRGHKEDFYALIHPHDRERVMSLLEGDTNKPVSEEFRWVPGSGTQMHLLMRGVRGEGGDRHIFHGVLTDVTEIRSRDADKEGILRAINVKDSESLAMAAHDMRGSLAIISMVYDLLEEKTEDVVFKFLIKKGKTGASRLQDIISAVLEVSQLENHHSVYKASVGLDFLIRRSASQFELLAKGKEIHLSTEFNEVQAQVDGNKVLRAIDNLISNAIKFSYPGSEIVVSCYFEEDMACVSVKDQGIGIPAENKPLLFDKFSKNIRKAGTNGETSIGLGLSIVKRIVDLHEGVIQVESEVGEGATFTLKFPLE